MFNMKISSKHFFLLNFLALFLGFNIHPTTASEVNLSGLKELKEVGWEYLDHDEVQEQLDREKVISRKNDIYLLSKTKESIISGNLEMAEYYLIKISSEHSRLYVIKKRYLALIKFIKEDYKGAIKELSAKEFWNTVYFKDVCILKIAAQLQFKLTSTLVSDFQSCDRQTLKYTDTEHMWLDNMKFLKQKRFKLIKGAGHTDLSTILTNNDTIRTWLKTGLYLNKEKMLFRNLKHLPESSYSNSRIRELVGLIHYRNGDIKKAFDFIEDLDSPNAENIKGNIKLTEKKYELAFGHYMLALKRKQNSKNALERAIPLSWIVGNWQDGLNLLRRILTNKDNKKEILTLDTLFRIRMNKFQESEAQIRYLDEKYLKKPPFELQLMKAYVLLRNKDNKGFHDSTSSSCRDFDGLSCWMSLQAGLWENIGKTIDRKEKIPNGQGFNIEALKKKSPIAEIMELRYLDQRDIEELDSALVTVELGSLKK